MFKSALQGSFFDTAGGRSKRGGSSYVRFASTLAPAPRSPSTSRQTSSGGGGGSIAVNSSSTISLRLFIGQATIQLSHHTTTTTEDSPPPSSTASLNIIFNDLIIALTSRNRQRHHQSADIIDLESKLNATFNGIEIYEIVSDSETETERKKKQITSFIKSKDSNTIYSSPDVIVDLIYTTSKSTFGSILKQPKVEISVIMTQMILSASIKQLEKWGKCVTKLVDLQVTTEPTSTNVSVVVTIPCIEVYLMSDDSISASVWIDMNQALQLDVCSHNWSTLKTQKHLVETQGGLYFIFHNVYLSIKASSSDIKESDQYIGLTQAIMGMYICLPGDEGKLMKCKLINAYCNQKSSEDRVFIRRSNTNNSNATFNSQKASFNPSPTTDEEGESMGPTAPKVDISHILFIRAYLLEMDIEEREFHALLMLTETLVIKEEKMDLIDGFEGDEMTIEDIPYAGEKGMKEGEGGEEVSIGLHISTSYALINLSENSYELWEHVTTTSTSQNTTFQKLALFLQQAKRLAKTSDKTESKIQEKEKEKLKICVSIRDPEVELYSVQRQIFVALKANDLSIYEMTPRQFQYLQSIKFDLHKSVRKEEDEGVRIGEEKYVIPFIRRAFVPLVNQTSNSKNAASSTTGTLLADHSKYGNAFEIRLLLTHEDHMQDLHTIKSVHFFIDFYDILINHDPSSTWLFKLVRILTPQTAVQMIQNNLGSILDEIETFSPFLSPQEQEEIRLLTLENDGKSEFLATSMLQSQVSDMGNKILVLSPFEITKISVRVRDSLVDYCHVDKQSRVILSVNLIAISSTIVSNSDRVTLKLSLTGLNFFAGRQLTLITTTTTTTTAAANRKKNIVQKPTKMTSKISGNPKLLENPDNIGNLGKSGSGEEKSKLKVWMDDHRFVNLLEVDYLTNLVTMNQHELQDLSLSFTLGTCVIKGCYDSLVIFKDALAQWFVEFEASCAESETILRKKKKRALPTDNMLSTTESEGGMIGEEGMVDRVRYYDEITFATSTEQQRHQAEEPKQVLIPETLLQSRIDLSARHLHRDAPHPPPANSAKAKQREGMQDRGNNIIAIEDTNLMEDFYRQPTSPPPTAMMRKVQEEETPRWEADYGYDNNSTANNSHLSHDYNSYPSHTTSTRGVSAGGVVYGQQYDYQSSIADSTSASQQQYPYDDDYNNREEDDDLLFKSTLFEGQEEVTSELGDAEEDMQEEEILDDSDTLGNSSTAFPEEMQLYRSTSHNRESQQQQEMSTFGLSNLFSRRVIAEKKKEEDYEMKSINNHSNPDPHEERGDGVDVNDFEYYSREFEQQFRQFDPFHPSAPQPATSHNKATTLRQESGELVLAPAPAPSKEEAVATVSSRRQQPGLTAADINELEDLERAWEKVDTTTTTATNRLSHGSVDSASSQPQAQQAQQQPEQQARWYFNPSTLDIRPHYIPLVTAMEHDTDHRPMAERQLMTKVYVQLNGHFKLRLYSGSQWPANTDTTSALEEEGASGGGGDRTRSNSGSSKTVTFASDTATTTNSSRDKDKDRKKKASLFEEPPSSSLKRPSSSAAIPAPPPSTAESKPKEKPFLPLEERQALDFFMKTVSLQVSIYDHGLAGNKLTVSVTGNKAGAEEEGEWREFRGSESDLHSHHSQLPQQQAQQQQVLLAALPNQRITFSIQDFLLSFGSAKPNAQRKKVIGSWMNTQRPRDSSQPMVKFVLLGYGTTPGQVEYRIHLTALPLRIFLSDEIVAFARGIVEDNHLIPPPPSTVSPEDTTAPTAATVGGESDIYFQQVLITTLEVKIDYRASAISLKALQQGDYLQLLNIFPIDGLELSLKALKFNGVNGSVALANRLLKAWVEDIYANQLHRVISGAAPLKSLSNIGKDLQGLLYIPANEFRGRSNSTGHNKSAGGQSGQVLKQLQRGTKSLLSTITRETLDVSHKLTMFMAQTITDLAADSQPQSSSMQPPPSQQQTQTHVRQPRGLSEGLTRGYSSVAREFSSAAETVIAVPVRQYERLGPSGLITSVVRALPIAVLRPIAGLAEGLSYTILGVRNRLDPDGQQDEEDLYNVDFQIP